MSLVLEVKAKKECFQQTYYAMHPVFEKVQHYW